MEFNPNSDFDHDYDDQSRSREVSSGGKHPYKGRADSGFACDDGVFEYELSVAMNEVQNTRESHDMELDSNVVSIFNKEQIAKSPHEKVPKMAAKVATVSNYLLLAAAVRRIAEITSHLVLAKKTQD